MQAIMSEKLRKIIRDPQGIRALQKGMSKLSQNAETKKSTVIMVSGHQYKLQFIYSESKLNKKDIF